MLAIDRSPRAVAQAEANCVDLVLDTEPFDLVFAVRVGALDGRHPATGKLARARIRAPLAPPTVIVNILRSRRGRSSAWPEMPM